VQFPSRSGVSCWHAVSPAFCVGFSSRQGTYLGTLVTNWLEYFRFGNSLLLYRSRVCHFLSFGSGSVSYRPAVFPRNINPLFGSWTSPYLLCVFGGDFGTSAECFERNLRLPFIPFNRCFRSFVQFSDCQLILSCFTN
jgi:hypothetical protein